MNSLVLSFQEMKQSELSLVGGKGLNLGLLSKIQGIQVPDGFSVTTVGFRRAVEQNETYHTLLARLSKLKPEDRNQIGEVSKEIRKFLLNITIPSDVVEAVTHYHSRFGEEHAYAVRSSATAEDLPHASFAGQQDSYLHVIGKDSILEHIRKCWASLSRIGPSFTVCKMGLITARFTFPLSFRRWYPRRFQVFFLRLTP